MIHIQYSDGHQACFNYIKRKESFWNLTLTISKEKYVVLNCPGYTVCWSVSASVFVVFVFPQLTARVVLKLQLQLLVLNGWEYENICVHTYGGRRGSTKMLSESQITHDSWWTCTDDRWQKERFCMKTVPTPRAEPGTSIKYCLLNVWAELSIVLNDAGYLCY